MKFKTNHFHNTIAIQETERKNGLKYSIRQNRQRYFFPDEWMAFYDCLKEKQKLTFKSLINTGARINEVRHVKVEDIQPDRNYIIVKVTKSRNKDKTFKSRTIPISTEFTRYLKQYAKESELKPDNYLPILSTPAANIAMKKALQLAGIPDYKMFSIHNIRKTLECWLLALDVDSLKVSKHFGHSLAVAGKYYVSPESFSYDDKKMMRQIIGDLYERHS